MPSSGRQDQVAPNSEVRSGVVPFSRLQTHTVPHIDLPWGAA